MGLFDRIFGRQTPRPPVPEIKITVSMGPPPSPPPPAVSDDLSALQIELLSRLGRDPVSSFQGPWAGLNVRAELERYQRLGHLQEASIARKVDARFRLTELKPLLKGRGLKQAGKKAELIERLLAHVDPAEARALVHGLDLFELTHSGEALVVDLRARQEKALREAEGGIRAALARRDVREAGRVLARYEAGRPFQRGLGMNWADGVPDGMLAKTTALLDDPLEDLDVPDELKPRIRVELATSDLMGERPEEWGRRVLAVTGGSLPSASLDAFLRDPCGGFASSFEPDDVEGRAELWAHTHIFRASARSQLAEYRRTRAADGVSILGGEECDVCSKGPRNFPWNRADDIPLLPRHYGCRCLYVAWFRDSPRAR